MSKFLPQGNLRLQIGVNGSDGWITIPQGLTIKFTVTKKTLTSTQTANIRVYGLSSLHRDQIYKDKFAFTDIRHVTLQAGYSGFTPVIFDGTILQAYSEKEGNTDTVTVIEAFDGGAMMANGIVALAVDPQTSARDVISRLGASLPGVTSAPIVGSFPQRNMRSEVLVGNTWSILQDKSGGNSTIDGGQLIALNSNEAIASNRIPLISSATGLLGVPRRSGNLVEFDMVFEPRLRLFQIVDLESTFNQQFNGPHKVTGFEHRGAISTTEPVPNITTASFIWFPNPIASSVLENILLTT